MYSILDDLENPENKNIKKGTFRNPYKDIVEAYEQIEKNCTHIDNILALTPAEQKEWRDAQLDVAIKQNT